MLRTKYIIIFLLVILAYSLIFSFLYNYFVVIKIDEFNKKFKNIQRQLIVELPKRDTYLIKIWGLRYPERVYFNSKEVDPFCFRERGILKETYIKVDESLVNEEQNILDIIGNESYSVRIKNFCGASDSKNILVIFKSSRFLKFKPDRFIAVTFLTYIILIFLWVIFYIIVKYVFSNLKIGKIFFLYCLSNFGLFLSLLIFIFLFSFTPYRIILSHSAFLGLSICILFLTNFILFCQFIFRQSQTLILNPSIIKSIKPLSRAIKLPLGEIKESYLNLYIIKLILHFKRFTDQYLISAFIFLLLICMILLIFKLYTIAHWISYLAFFCLLTGIVIKITKSAKAKDI